MTTLDINQLKNQVNYISSIQCDYFAEACIIALENKGHLSGIQLKVDGDFQTSFILKWQSPIKVSGWKESRDIAENGSIAISFLLILELTEYEIIQQSVIGTGFDYWLGYKPSSKKSDPDNFLNARLEVSGINKGRRSVMTQRVRQKLKQVGVSDYLNIPAYIVVTEFGTPISIIIEK